MADKVRIGVIGVGGMGSGHANYINKGEISRAELTAVCDIDERRLERWDGIPQFTKSEELIRSGLVDAVMVATPHYAHTTVGIDAMNNGLHLLTEKPISVHKADAQRLIAAYKANPALKFQVMFNMRTEALCKKLKHIMESGELGELRRINWLATDWFRTQAYYNSGGWRATWAGEGGGVLMNQSPHNLDQLQRLFGMPSKIRAWMSFGKYHDIEVEDDVTAYLEYPNGATGVFITSTGEYPGTNRLEVVGERGKLVVEDGKIHFTRNELPMTEFSRGSHNAFSSIPTWEVDIPYHGHGDHAVVTQNWVDAILDGVELVAPAEEGINSVEISNAMTYSHLTGQTVELPLDAAAFEAKLKELCETSRFKKTVVEIEGEDLSKSFKKI